MENLEEPEKRSCAVCARVLHPVITGDETGWVHAEMDWADHPAVPVEQDEVHTQYRCDFCSADNPPWTLPTRAFDSGSFDLPGEQFDTMQGENFATCDECARLIETNQWNGLARRAARVMVEKHGLEGMEQVVEAGLKDFYRKLRKNITGGLRPLS